MKSPAKKIFVALLSGIVLLNAGLSFAQSDSVNPDNLKIYSSKEAESAERKREFWEKFRETVEPREKDPPQEVHPNEVNPEEVHPQEVHPQKARQNETDE